MLKPAVLALIVLSALTMAFLQRNLVLAEMDDSVRLFGYELRLQLRAELAWKDAADLKLQMEDGPPVVPDSLEVP
jgi:hypothetical protein